MLRGLCFVIVDEADSVLVDEARTPLIISNVGDSSQEEQIYARGHGHRAPAGSPASDFAIRPREHDVELTDRGGAARTGLAALRGRLDGAAAARGTDTPCAGSPLYLFQRDKQYLVRGGKVQIVDEYTGRVMADRSWERGLHQMIEAKEGCALTGQQETLARISYQRFFRRYLRVAGMTGTAQRGGARALVGLPPAGGHDTDQSPGAAPAPARRGLCSPPTRSGRPSSIRCAALQAEGRPVLVGTRSVAASEHLSELLDGRRTAHTRC